MITTAFIQMELLPCRQEFQSQQSYEKYLILKTEPGEI